MNLKSILIVLSVLMIGFRLPAQEIEKWGMYEYTLKGPVKGNPFQDVVLSATFTHGDISREVKGFYAGEGKYKVRFMPEEEGEWKFATVCNIKSLNNKKGVFQFI